MLRTRARFWVLRGVSGKALVVVPVSGVFASSLWPCTHQRIPFFVFSDVRNFAVRLCVNIVVIENFMFGTLTWSTPFFPLITFLFQKYFTQGLFLEHQGLEVDLPAAPALPGPSECEARTVWLYTRSNCFYGPLHYRRQSYSSLRLCALAIFIYYIPLGVCFLGRGYEPRLWGGLKTDFFFDNYLASNGEISHRTPC